MSNIKLLDCTLREGGYVNNWEFGCKNIQNILHNLEKSGIDYIECGYLKPVEYNPNKTLYSKISDFDDFLGTNNSKLAFMINFGEYDIDYIPENKDIFLRIAFKKHQYIDAIKYCEVLKNKGYKVFVNPMHTNTYSETELENLIELVNNIRPYAFTVTDSTGSMRENELKKILKKIEKLDNTISLCFHSHNNLQLSFSNAQYFINNCSKRDIIIDCTLSGIGRGAGNLCTEIIALYLNNFCKKEYNISPILETIDTYIKPIYAQNPWGYSVPYYLSGLNNCHPDYAKYLINKSLSYERINEILQKIPLENKTMYNENIIRHLI